MVSADDQPHHVYRRPSQAERDALAASNRANFEPIILAMDGRTIIYREGIIRLTRVSDVRTDDHGFMASAVALSRIQAFVPDTVPLDSWQFGGSWEMMREAGRCLIAGYGGWQLYADAELVARVMELMPAGESSREEITRLMREFSGD